MKKKINWKIWGIVAACICCVICVFTIPNLFEQPNCAVLDVDYTTNDDGTYTCRGNTYKYKTEVSGIDGELQTTYIILTNNIETSFEDVRYSLIKAEMSTGIPEFVILGWYY